MRTEFVLDVKYMMKNKLDWNFRWDKLKKLVKPYISKSGKNYDCVVPVSGGQDSYYILHLVKKLT